MSKPIKFLLIGTLCLVFLLGGFIGGYLMNADYAGAPVKYAEVKDQSEGILDLMGREALEPPSETSATIGAIDGILKSGGDKYARYLPAEKFTAYTEQMEGAFGGMGVVLEEKDGTVGVVQVYKNTPASREGVKKGDYFYTINGVSRETWTMEEVRKRVKGEPGTKVKLTMMRPYKKGDVMNMRYPLGVPYNITITRAIIEVPNTESSLMQGDIGYIRLFEFNRRSTDEVKREITSLTKKGAKKFILDLRDNPGGDLQEAVGVASLFIKEGPIVKIESRVDGTQILNASGVYTTGAPLVVLIDENSASASEIVSGALLDYKRAKLVGMKTYGKGSVQTQFDYADGAVLFTTAHYLTPKSRVINGVGNTPDIVVPMALDLQADPKTDLQLQAAIKELRK